MLAILKAAGRLPEHLGPSCYDCWLDSKLNLDSLAEFTMHFKQPGAEVTVTIFYSMQIQECRFFIKF